MEITDYHAKYFAHELTRRCASDEVDKLVPVLADAHVDLNRHRVEVGWLALQNPLPKGANDPPGAKAKILASERADEFKTV